MTEAADLKVVCHKIDSLGERMGRIEAILDKNIEASNDRLRELEKQTAVMEKGVQAICDDVDNLQEKSNRNDVLVVIGNLIIVVAASIANAFGMRE